MINSNSWKCPYCHHYQILSEQTYHRPGVRLETDLSIYGKIYSNVITITCSNPECREITISFEIHEITKTDHYGRASQTKFLKSWNLLPEASSKPLPNYVPGPIKKDYEQSCRIKDLCPNASATMSRRCLQGMIRDFCQIKRSTLAKEIKELENQVNEGKGPIEVNSDVLSAINNVRKIGNIGAHMDKNINLMLDVEPNEAEALIGLNELLFKEWYISRFERSKNIKELATIVARKEEIITRSKEPIPTNKLSDEMETNEA